MHNFLLRLLFVSDILDLAMQHQASITSFYRTSYRNINVGGHPQSQHLTGNALDLVIDDMSPERKKLLIKAIKLLGYKAIDETDHIHVQRF